MSIQHMQMVFDAGNLTAPQKAVLLAYCNFTDAHGYCWPGVERIADMTGLSASGVKKVRKQLIESELLKTVSRGKKGGGRTTNASRINVKRLQSMKRPERTYDDNVMDGLGFEEDVTEQSEGAPQGPNGSPEDQQRYLEGTNEGSPGTPYPSVDPSADPSSSSVALEDITSQVTPPVTEKKTKKSPEDTVLERLAHMSPTLEEATAVVDLVRMQAAARGRRVEYPTSYLEGRELRVLVEDLETVRRRSRKPSADVCGLHSVLLEFGSCSSCMGDIKAGDAEAVRAHLLEAGGDSRPDLVAVLGVPQVSAHTSEGGWSWENQLRGERRARSGHTP